MFRYNLCIMLQLTRHKQVEESKKSLFLLFDLGCCLHCLLALSLSESFCINFHNIVLSCIRKKRDTGKGNVDEKIEKNDFMLLFFIFLISFSLVVFSSFIFMIPFHCFLAKHRYNELNLKTLNSSCCYI